MLSIENDMVIIDIGLKSEGRIPLTEFSSPGKDLDIEINQTLKVFIENIWCFSKNKIDLFQESTLEKFFG